MADAGFGSVELVVFIGKKAKESGTKLHAIVCVKQAHALFPKEVLEATLKDAPGGKWATLRRLRCDPVLFSAPRVRATAARRRP